MLPRREHRDLDRDERLVQPGARGVDSSPAHSAFPTERHQSLHGVAVEIWNFHAPCFWVSRLASSIAACSLLTRYDSMPSNGSSGSPASASGRQIDKSTILVGLASMLKCRPSVERTSAHINSSLSV